MIGKQGARDTRLFREKSLQVLLRQEGGPGTQARAVAGRWWWEMNETRVTSGRRRPQQRWIPGVEGSRQQPAGWR